MKSDKLSRKLGQIKLEVRDTASGHKRVFINDDDLKHDTSFDIHELKILREFARQQGNKLVISFWEIKPGKTKKTIAIYKKLGFGGNIQPDGLRFYVRFNKKVCLCREELNKYVDHSQLKYIRVDKS